MYSLVWIKVGQGPITLAVGAVGRCLNICLSSIFSLFLLPLWETARYRLKYCLKGPLNPKQPTNEQMYSCFYSHSSITTYRKGNKYLSWVYGVDRKICHEVTDRHHEACRVMPNSDPE